MGELDKLETFGYNDNPWSDAFQHEIMSLATPDIRGLLKAFSEDDGMLRCCEWGFYRSMLYLMHKREEESGDGFEMLPGERDPVLRGLNPLEYLATFYPESAEVYDIPYDTPYIADYMPHDCVDAVRLMGSDEVRGRDVPGDQL